MSIINLKHEPPNGLNLVSLFAGCGGSSLGYQAAGYDIRLSVEWDKSAANIYRDNFPGTPIFQGDIGDLDIEQIYDLSGLKEGELDVLDGSPPCQGFSSAGERKFTDDRNQLFREYVRILKGLQPRAFIMENVSGLRKGKMKLMFAVMTKALKECGYRVSCRELNAWWYGVPQTRTRLIWIGIREDLPYEPSHPEPIVRRPISVREAFGNHLDTTTLLENHIWGTGQAKQQEAFDNGTGDKDHYSFLDAPANTLMASRPPLLMKKGTFTTVSKWEELNRPAKTLVTHKPKLAGSFSFPKNTERNGKPLDKPSGTLAAIRPPSMFENMEVRYITMEEAKILQSFPGDFKIDIYKYIGNSVPPLMAQAIGKHVAGILRGTDAN
jgi:DNA-cytosine methyltransferase